MRFDEIEEMIDEILSFLNTSDPTSPKMNTEDLTEETDLPQPNVAQETEKVTSWPGLGYLGILHLKQAK